MEDRSYSSLERKEQTRQNGTVIYMGNIRFPDKSAAAHRVINNAKIFQTLDFNVVFLGVSQGEPFDGIRQSAYDRRFFEEAYPDTARRWIDHVFSVKNIRRFAEKFDDLKLIVAYNVPYATFKALKKAFKNSAVKLAYDCTEWNGYAEGSLFKRLYKKIDEFEIIHLLHKKCDNIIAVSSVIQNQYQGCNTLLLPPLVDVTDPVWHQDSETHPDTFEFCFSAATFDNKDDPGNIIRAFGRLEDTDARLTVIGMEKEEALQRYPDIRDTVKTDIRISFAGHLSHRDVIRRLLSSDCFVFFRRDIRRNRAGFPTKFVEAYTCSIPVLTNRIGDVGHYAKSRKRVILTEDTSVDNIKEQLQNILRSSRSTGRKTDDTFDYRHYISRTVEWINKIC